MATVFTNIISGEITSYKIAENEKFLAFLDINPVQLGHTLVVPKVEVDNFFDLDDETVGEIMVFAKPIANRIKSALGCRKVAVVVIGLEVPHAHVHLIPINKESDIDFRNKLNPDKQEFERIQQLLQM